MPFSFSFLWIYFTYVHDLCGWTTIFLLYRNNMLRFWFAIQWVSVANLLLRWIMKLNLTLAFSANAKSNMSCDIFVEVLLVNNIGKSFMAFSQIWLSAPYGKLFKPNREFCVQINLLFIHFTKCIYIQSEQTDAQAINLQLYSFLQKLPTFTIFVTIVPPKLMKTNGNRIMFWFVSFQNENKRNDLFSFR